GAVWLRIIEAERYRHRFGKTGQRTCAGGQSAGARTGAASGGDVSGVGVVSVAEYVRQRHVWFEIETRPTESGTARGCKILSSPGGTGKVHGSQCARALWRNETARGARPSTRAESAGAAHGRAIRRAGCHDTRTTLRRHPNDLAKTS